jgi:hypothetical protein
LTHSPSPHEKNKKQLQNKNKAPRSQVAIKHANSGCPVLCFENYSITNPI